MSAPPGAVGARLSALHAATFMGLGVYLPFFPVWLQSRALGPTLIGIVIAIPIVVRIALTAPLLALADRTFGARRLLLISHLGQLIGYPILAALENGILIAMMVGLLAVFQAAVIPGNDLVTTEALRRFPRLHYGRIRGFGSLAFLLASVATGYLVDALGVGAVIVALALTPLLGLAATHLAMATSGSADRQPTEAARETATGRLPGVLWLVMLAAALTQGSHGGLYAFGSIHWRSIGFSDTVIGYFWAVGVLAEIAVFYLLGEAVGRGSFGLGLLLAGSAAATLRFALLSLDPGLVATFALQALHGLSFGASHLGAMAAMAALAPEAARGRTLGVAGSLVALGSAAAAIASGEIYRASGPAVFAWMAPLGGLGFVLAIFAIRSLSRQQNATRPM
jgi:PPP family 3-phenylpropionic acid transporter